MSKKGFISNVTESFLKTEPKDNQRPKPELEITRDELYISSNSVHYVTSVLDRYFVVHTVLRESLVFTFMSHTYTYFSNLPKSSLTETHSNIHKRPENQNE